MFLSRTTTSGPLRPVLRADFERLASFASIGVCCTVAFAAIFWGLRHVTGPLQANLGALSITLLFNFAANRHLTFRAHRGPLLRQASGYGLVYFFGLAASSGALWFLLEAFHHPTGLIEVALATGASGLATVLRYAMLTRWVFRTGVDPAQATGATNG